MRTGLPLVAAPTRPLRVAMIGQRGVPASFGGVEHHVEELGSRLAERGHEVTVYTRRNYVTEQYDEYRGMRIRSLPTVSSKHLDAIVHSTLSTVDAIKDSFDILHYHAVGPGIPSLLARYLSRAKVVLTVHGLDGERAKWGTAARSVLKTAEWLSARVPDATIVVSRDLARHYASRYARKTWYIPNGVERGTRLPAARIKEGFGLEEGGYLLFVGRMVPEKAPDRLVRVFRKIKRDVRLVLVGDSSYTSDYLQALRLEGARDDRVIFTGYVYGETLAELYSNAAAFVLPSSLEGLPLTLLEAASYGTPVIASDIPPHVEIIRSDGPGAHLFRGGDDEALAAALERVLDNPEAERAGARALRDRVLRSYRWDAAVEATERLYERVTRGPG